LVPAHHDRSVAAGSEVGGAHVLADARRRIGAARSSTVVPRASGLAARAPGVRKARSASLGHARKDEHGLLGALIRPIFAADSLAQARDRLSEAVAHLDVLVEQHPRDDLHQATGRDLLCSGRAAND
jgi:hypothetical protein